MNRILWMFVLYMALFDHLQNFVVFLLVDFVGTDFDMMHMDFEDFGNLDLMNMDLNLENLGYFEVVDLDMMHMDLNFEGFDLMHIDFEDFGNLDLMHMDLNFEGFDLENLGYFEVVDLDMVHMDFEGLVCFEVADYMVDKDFGDLTYFQVDFDKVHKDLNFVDFGNFEVADYMVDNFDHIGYIVDCIDYIVDYIQELDIVDNLGNFAADIPIVVGWFLVLESPAAQVRLALCKLAGYTVVSFVLVEIENIVVDFETLEADFAVGKGAVVY